MKAVIQRQETEDAAKLKHRNDTKTLNPEEDF